VFDLKEGELSAVINDVSGSYIYKIVSRTTPTVPMYRTKFENTLRSQRLQAMRQKVANLGIVGTQQGLLWP